MINMTGYLVQYNFSADNKYVCESQSFDEKEGAFSFAIENNGVVNEFIRDNSIVKIVPIANFR